MGDAPVESCGGDARRAIADVVARPRRLWAGPRLTAELQTTLPPGMIALALRHQSGDAVWAELVPTLQVSGRMAGRIRLDARRGRTTLGSIEPRYARHCEPLFSAVLDDGVTHGVVIFSRLGGADPRAELVIGAPEPVPMWDFVQHPSPGH